MKNIKNYIIIILCVFLNGCAIFNFGYTPDENLNIYNNDENIHKYNLSYSVYYFTNRFDIIGNSLEQNLTKRIGESLKQSNLYSKVINQSLESMSDYHVHFQIILQAPTVNDAVAVGLLSGYTLALIPVWETLTYDMSATLYHKKEKIYSISTAELLKCYIWLPFAPIGLIWNNWFAIQHVEEKEINYLINNLSNFNLEFIKRIKTKKIRRDKTTF